MFGKRHRNRQRGAAPDSRETAAETCDALTLRHAPKGCACRVRRHRACGAVRQRLLDLGFLPGAEVEVVRVATLGDPIEVRIGGYFVALRKEEADRIDVELPEAAVG
ncbi:FeoA family protein [Megalodesulfovibrio paquesii]